MVRSILAVVLGLILGSVVMFVVESVGMLVNPLPAGVDPNDAEALKALWETAPLSAKLLVLLAWGVGSLAGGWLAAWIGRRSPIIHALIVGAVLQAAGIFNMVTFPSPAWFWVVGLLIFLPTAFLGAQLAPRRQPQTTG